ncbi:hypothetical protein [Azospirillum canadense]|uniref:hypothetical protein n=1 Tax=Azospirillum canadense TaxID=403962 RepID=UPI002225BB1E|nr:hypothetical protein [Azospirillum canadense]MCW2243157.1 hypothetical protein [Azospirillum canadense]
MAERCFLMPVLTATEALQALAVLAPHAEAARAARLRVRLEGDGYARLLIPDPFVQTGSSAHRKQREEVFNHLRWAVAAALDREPDDEEAHLDLDGGDLQEAFEAVPRLLLESGWSRRGETAQPVPGEAVVLLASADEEAAWSIFDQLNVHATAVRVTAAQAADGGGIHLFHVRDDDARVSSFQGLRTSGFLDAAAVLEGFAFGGRSVFLPSGNPPDAQALDPFFRACAVIADVARPSERGPVLALTVAGAGDARRIDVYPLNRLRYRDKTGVWPNAAGRADIVRVHDLAGSDAMVEALAARVRAAEPLVGYELELRDGFPAPGADTDLLRVQEKIAYYTELAAYLSGLARPQPILMRFDDRALPALADALRRFPLMDVDDGRLRYGFQATGADGGVHYLLVSPDETAPASPLPEGLWRDMLDAEPMVFRVDPFFARFYTEARPQSVVFVPERATLFPPLHSWDQADIDAYLRDTLAVWFHGQRGAQTIPERPFYLFRHDDRGAGRVVVEVLDAAAFVPLRQRIGWLNRNLELRHRLDIEGLVVELADKAGRAALADRVAADEEVALAAFDAADRRVERHMGGQLEELLDLLTEEAGTAASRAASAVETLDRLYADLDVIEAAVAELTKRTRAVETAVSGLELERTSFAERRERLQGDVVDVLEASDATLASLEASVGERIQRLKGAYERLHAMLVARRSYR